MTRIEAVILAVLFVAICADSAWPSEDPLRAAVAGLVAPAPNHRLRKQSELTAFVSDVRTVEHETEIDAYTIAGLAYLESSLRLDVTGSRGEIGLMQVFGAARVGCDLTTQIGQLRCGATWLRKCRDLCGDDRGMLTMYATGECRTRKERIKRLIKYRLAFVARLKGEK